MRFLQTIMAILIAASLATAQRVTGEIRLQVQDASGAVLQAAGSIVAHATGVDRTFETDAEGHQTIRSLPLGRYLLQVERPGFGIYSNIVEIQSQAPLTLDVTLSPSPIETRVEVREEEILLDPMRIATTQYLSPEALNNRPSSSPGRSVVELVNTQPGWLLEANGVLHPRGSEYDVQYVIDGIPLYDNRSPAFAQSLGVEEFQSLIIRTAGYPAEFGLKLGGVIEMTSERDSRQGLHGSAVSEISSFGTRSAFASTRYTAGSTSVGISAEGMMTDRYLDPPVEQNFTNHASGGGFSLAFERNWSLPDRTRFYLQRRRTGFLVPNELLQQAAGQRQDRSAEENLVQVSHSHIFSKHVLGQFRSMVRDTGAKLWSNALSTPILPSQDRGFREGYGGGHVSMHSGRHELKAGAEAFFSSIHEDLAFHIVSYRINNVRIFDRDIPADFRFSQSRRGQTQSAYLSDLWRGGGLTASIGLRFDRYSLVQNETAWSPRLGAAYELPRAGMVLRASYDRIFQIPAMENILLASSDLVRNLGGEGRFLPLRSSRGNYFELGFSKSLLDRVRIDGGWYRRRSDNFSDDSLLLNTGVSFPTAFSKAEVRGYEVKVEVPSWGPFSGYASYSNMVGIGNLPVAGGLFLGDNVDELVNSDDSFPITQDQRNTVRLHLRVKPHNRIWFAANGDYNSGLPFEIEGVTNQAFIAQQYGARILSKVNFARGRVHPSTSLDASVGIELMRLDKKRISIQAEACNLGNRLNVINFAGVFSGTALGTPRRYAIRLRAEF